MFILIKSWPSPCRTSWPVSRACCRGCCFHRRSLLLLLLWCNKLVRVERTGIASSFHRAVGPKKNCAHFDLHITIISILPLWVDFGRKYMPVQGLRWWRGRAFVEVVDKFGLWVRLLVALSFQRLEEMGVGLTFGRTPSTPRRRLNLTVHVHDLCLPSINLQQFWINSTNIIIHR